MTGCCVATMIDTFHGDWNDRPTSAGLRAAAADLRSRAAGRPIAAAFKATQGLYVDPTFHPLWRQARDEGLFDVVIAYSFGIGGDPLGHASFFVETVASADGGRIGPGALTAADLEAEPHGNHLLGDDAYRFCDRIDADAGRHGVIYTNRWWWKTALGADMAFSRWPLWEADDRGNTPAGPAWPNEGLITQFGQGPVDGIPAGDVDLNHIEDDGALLALADGTAPHSPQRPQEDLMAAVTVDAQGEELTPAGQRPTYRAVQVGTDAAPLGRLLAYNGAPLAHPTGVGFGVPYTDVPGMIGLPIVAELTRDRTAVRIVTEQGLAYHVAIR